MSTTVIGLKRCRSGHVIGQMRKNGSGTEMLEQFRQAIDYRAEMPEAVDVSALIMGRAVVRCSICGDDVAWNEAQPRHAPRAVFE